MADRPDGKGAGTERVTFTRPAAERIANAVRTVEQGDRDCGPLRFERIGGGGGGKPIRLCSWTASWSYGSTAVITFTPGTASTATATNRILGVGPGEGWVANGTAGWSLVSFDMTKLAGYSTSTVQLFGHDSSAVAHWYSITTCAAT